jgi:general L-amino acid transport system permease protein
LAAGILLFIAIAPVLFSNLPRKMLTFSLIYPFLAVWLIWGGSIWFPLMVMAGFGIGYTSLRFLTPVFGSLASIVIAVLAAIVWWLFLASPVANAIQNVIPLGLLSVKSSLLGGLMLSIIIGVAGIACSFPLGIILALGRRSDMFIVKILSVGYIEFIRGVPLITLLFVASTLLNYFLPPGTNFDLLLRVIILVTMFQAAYLAEVIRGGLAALPVGQYEAANALGLDYWKSMRLVIMPQALKISIPGIVGSFIGLFKDTTLVSIISLLDPVGFINAIRGTAEWQGILWELYVFLILMFWIFTFSMSRYSMYLERKLQTGH